MGISEIAQTFGVDWPHLLSQLVSFSLVCALLHRFAYRPVLQMLETRRRQIATGLAEAAAAHERLAAAERERGEALRTAQVEATRIVADARTTAKQVADHEAAHATMSGQQILKRARDDAERERVRVLADVKRHAAHLIAQATAVVAGKVLSESDQQRLADEALRRIA